MSTEAEPLAQPAVQNNKRKSVNTDRVKEGVATYRHLKEVGIGNQLAIGELVTTAEDKWTGPEYELFLNHIKMSDSHADQWIAIANCKHFENQKYWMLLPDSFRAMRAITMLTSEQFATGVMNHKFNPDMTEADVRELGTKLFKLQDFKDDEKIEIIKEAKKQGLLGDHHGRRKAEKKVRLEQLAARFGASQNTILKILKEKPPATAGPVAVPDRMTGQEVSHEATAPLGDEPSAEQIEASQEMDFLEDGNEVIVQEMAEGLKRLAVQREIRGVLHKYGFKNRVVTITAKSA